MFHDLKVTTKGIEENDKKLDIGTRLCNGLKKESDLWQQTIQDFEQERRLLVGDCLTAAAFLSYCGPFNFPLR